jgi:alanine dehydrogenase
MMPDTPSRAVIADLVTKADLVIGVVLVPGASLS